MHGQMKRSSKHLFAATLKESELCPLVLFSFSSPKFFFLLAVVTYSSCPRGSQ